METTKKTKTPAPQADSMKDLYQDDISTKTTKAAGSKFGRSYIILVKPLITEKTANLSTDAKYSFEVAEKANKIEIAKAIEDVYGIKPSKVNVVKMLGKTKRHGKITGKRKDWKKAIVTLPKGKTIDVYEGV